MHTLLIAHADQTHREFLIDKGLRDAREHYATLFAAQLDPHALDNATIAAYSASAPTASRAATSTNSSYGAGAANA